MNTFNGLAAVNRKTFYLILIDFFHCHSRGFPRHWSNDWAPIHCHTKIVAPISYLFLLLFQIQIGHETLEHRRRFIVKPFAFVCLHKENEKNGKIRDEYVYCNVIHFNTIRWHLLFPFAAASAVWLIVAWFRWMDRLRQVYISIRLFEFNGFSAERFSWMHFPNKENRSCENGHLRNLVFILTQKSEINNDIHKFEYIFHL